jgi:hypothetical protein
MRMIMALALAAFPSPSALANSDNTHHVSLFQVEKWRFSCDVGAYSFTSCSANRKFGQSLITLAENLEITVSGGCKSSRLPVNVVVEPTKVDGRWLPNILEIKGVASELLNSRRKACGVASLSKDDEASIEIASRIFIEMVNR